MPASDRYVFVAIAIGVLLILGAGWMINRQITVRLDRYHAARPAPFRLGPALTLEEQVANLTARVITLEAR
jgi:hypothetical protein